MSDESKLTFKDKRDIAIQSGLQLIPYVGGSLSTLISEENKKSNLNGWKHSTLKLHYNLNKYTLNLEHWKGMTLMHLRPLLRR
jgi:hypothetical protein